ncbi:hypothetical protein BDN70DRAFT_936092 [Pholiota conissans]|uniref:Uncharacterized protein n=1 Tax=Pholiota conissans TaxID=109636 RepID=A0A9P5YWH3_9AGAR|nr:hypothetical protein BDN70DRAFT_936092 [Pholiota conissans]
MTPTESSDASLKVHSGTDAVHVTGPVDIVPIALFTVIPPGPFAFALAPPSARSSLRLLGLNSMLFDPIFIHTSPSPTSTHIPPLTHSPLSTLNLKIYRATLPPSIIDYRLSAISGQDGIPSYVTHHAISKISHVASWVQIDVVKSLVARTYFRIHMQRRIPPPSHSLSLRLRHESHIVSPFTHRTLIIARMVIPPSIPSLSDLALANYTLLFFSSTHTPSVPPSPSQTPIAHVHATVRTPASQASIMHCGEIGRYRILYAANSD